MRFTFVVICLFPVVVGCSTLPVTDGFSTALPPPKSRVLVWGNYPSAVTTATTWLTKRGISPVEQASLWKVMDQEDVQRLHTLKDESSLLDAAKELGAGEVVFVTKSGDIRAPMVSVRGVDVSTADIVWSGTARLSGFVKRPLPDLVADLTCQALATAWGERRTGTEWFYSSEDACTPHPRNDENDGAFLGIF